LFVEDLEKQLMPATMCHVNIALVSTMKNRSGLMQKDVTTGQSKLTLLQII